MDIPMRKSEYQPHSSCSISLLLSLAKLTNLCGQSNEGVQVSRKIQGNQLTLDSFRQPITECQRFSVPDYPSSPVLSNSNQPALNYPASPDLRESTQLVLDYPSMIDLRNSTQSVLGYPSLPDSHCTQGDNKGKQTFKLLLL